MIRLRFLLGGYKSNNFLASIDRGSMYFASVFACLKNEDLTLQP